MKRWHEDYNRHTLNTWRVHHRHHVEQNKSFGRGRDPQEVDCPCDNQQGRFFKRDSFDCGKPRCQICHGEKFPVRQKSFDELKMDQVEKEQLDELMFE